MREALTLFLVAAAALWLLRTARRSLTGRGPEAGCGAGRCPGARGEGREPAARRRADEPR